MELTENWGTGGTKHPAQATPSDLSLSESQRPNTEGTAANPEGADGPAARQPGQGEDVPCRGRAQPLLGEWVARPKHSGSGRVPRLPAPALAGCVGRSGHSRWYQREPLGVNAHNPEVPEKDPTLAFSCGKWGLVIPPGPGAGRAPAIPPAQPRQKGRRVAGRNGPRGLTTRGWGS